MSDAATAVPADYKKGLEGVVAGTSAICTVGREGNDLLYRGYSIRELVNVATFEEVAAMLVLGEKPTKATTEVFTKKIVAGRALPQALREVLDRIPKTAHPMDVLRTGVSFLGHLEDEDTKNPANTVARLLGIAPSIITYWWRVAHGESAPKQSYAGNDIGGYFLHELFGKTPDPLEAKLMNTSLILYAEHGFNASTFVGRCVTSTNADMHGAVSAAIAALKGNLHGGANEAAMEMILPFKTPDEAEAAIMHKLAHKEKIMGFGHRVYKLRDPRNGIIKEYAAELAKLRNMQNLFDIFDRVEMVMMREKKMFANADFFHAFAYYALGIPIPLYTPIFVFSRISGWCAHVLEQRADNRIIRPSEHYTGPEKRSWAANA